MSKLERFSAVVGMLLMGVAAYIVSVDRKAMKQRISETPPPVEEMGEKLKQAWAGHHNR